MGSGEKPMGAGCSARDAGAGAQDGDVQSPGSKVQSQVAGEAEFEYLRSKTDFSPGVECGEGGISLATDAHGCTQIGTGTDKEDFLTADKAGFARMGSGNRNIEHPTSNAEHRMQEGDSITRTTTRTRTNSEDRHLSPSQWLPKPATSQLPHESNALRATWSPIEAERVGIEKTANIEHPTSNAEHRMQEGDSITRTRTTTRTNMEDDGGAGVEGLPA